jgi:Protein of unknown function (DUF1838)
MIEPSRRSLLMTAGMVLASSGINVAEASSRESIPVKPKLMSFEDPQDNLNALVRILGSTDNTLRFNVGYGRSFAIFKDELAIPLFDAKAVQWIRFKENQDGSYTRQTAFVQYHYGLGGAFGDTWKNPLTGEVTQLPVFKNDFGEARYTIYGVDVPAAMEVESIEDARKPRIYPWLVLNDDVWLSKEEFARYKSAREGRKLVENSVRTYHTKLSELNDQGRPSVSASMNEHSQSELFGFLNPPKEKTGHMLWRFVSKKYDSIVELPADIRGEVEKRTPEFWDIPA